MRSGEEDKDPNEHGLGSLSVLFAAQLTWITKLIYFSTYKYTEENWSKNFLYTFYAIHLQCVVEGLEPVAAATETLDQGINEDLKGKKTKSSSFIIYRDEC